MQTAQSPLTDTELLARFEVDAGRGFLPAADPAGQLPGALAAWDQAGAELPKLLMTDQVRTRLGRLPMLDPAGLDGRAAQERAMMLLSYLGHAYVWGERKAAYVLPAPIAVPWHAVATMLGRPPVLSYASYALHNWRRLDAARAIELGNIALLQNFWGGVDEEWFILIHIDIEARAGQLLAGVPVAMRAAAQNDLGNLTVVLTTIAGAMDAMYATLCRMPEFCDPYIYYNRVRPYIHGWRNQPTLPSGLVYEGVEAYRNKPQKFLGETGAQSSIIPALDGLLGVTHQPGPLNDYLLEMREYMPPAHRGWIAHVENNSSVRRAVGAAGDAGLREVYDRCIAGVEQFRAKHLEYAARYIFHQAQKSAGNPTAIGTGGTPFMPYLKKHLDETSEHKLN